MNKVGNNKLEELETDLLLEAIFRYYGYDFRVYEPGAVRRRIREAMMASRISTISRFQEKVLREPAFLERFLQTFSAPEVAMFSDSGFYRSFRSTVIPLLKTYPFVRIWYAGCSTGQGVYSIAIVLREEGIGARCRIYATDLSERAIQDARRGAYPASLLDAYSANYSQSGGAESFSGYCKRTRNRIVINPSLKTNIVFSEHNLATDGSFNEFQLIVFREGLGGLNHTLRARVDGLIYDSLSRFGILALNAGESLESMPHEASYRLMDKESGLYQKVLASARTQACHN
jgi:chemotaxis protein methyltransferase CheR